jgi:hypothetical protein
VFWDDFYDVITTVKLIPVLKTVERIAKQPIQTLYLIENGGNRQKMAQKRSPLCIRRADDTRFNDNSHWMSTIGIRITTGSRNKDHASQQAAPVFL